MQAPDLAVQEMSRCVNQLGFPGVQIGSHINTWDLNAPELYPVYAVSTFAFSRTCFIHTKAFGLFVCLFLCFCFFFVKSFSFVSVCVGHFKSILPLMTGRWETQLLDICASVGHADRWQNGKILAALVSWWVWLSVLKWHSTVFYISFHLNYVFSFHGNATRISTTAI